MKRSLKLTVWSVTIALTMIFLNVHANSDKDILFYCSFDKTVTPEIAKGNNIPIKQGDLIFFPGKKGKAVKLGKDGVFLAYKSKKNINLEIGTLACWIKPVNWQPGKTAENISFYQFFSLVHGQDVLTLSISQRKAWANLNFSLHSALHKIPYVKRALHHKIGGKWK